MILSDLRILEEIEKGTIKVDPYDRNCLGSNSYDVHLGKWLATYNEHILDAKKHNKIDYFEIPEEGFVLYPHIFYLGVTEEYTETHAHVPFLEGKSSTGRLGIDIHPHPFILTDNCSCVITTMRNGEMILLIRQIGFSCIGDPD